MRPLTPLHLPILHHYLPKHPLPDGAGSAGCSSRCCFALRCGAASRWSRAVSLPAVTPRWCRALRFGPASRWCFAPSLAAAASRWCRALRCGADSRWCFAPSLAVAASRWCRFGRLLVPKVPCFALWSCFPMVLCAVTGGSCFSMMPERLPRRISHATAPAERQPLPHRLALRLRAPPIHEGHGRPRSVRKSSRLRWKHLSSGGGGTRLSEVSC